MKMQRKRLLSIVLAASMALNMAAFSVSADEGAVSGRGGSGVETASSSDAERETQAKEPEKETETAKPEKETGETETKEETAAQESEGEAETEETTEAETSAADEADTEEETKAETSSEAEETESSPAESEAAEESKPLPVLEEETTLAPDECICKDKCTEDNMNERCPVCGADNAGPEDCLGGLTDIVLSYQVSFDDGDLPSDLPDSDEMFAGYVDKVFYEVDDSVAYGNFGEDRLEGKERNAYWLMKNAAIEIASGARTSTEIKTNLDELGVTGKMTWSAEELGVSSILDSRGEVSQEAVNAIFSKFMPDLDIVISYLLVNCPYEMYWYDKTEGTATAGLKLRSASANSITFRESEIIYRMEVAKAYQGSNQYTTNSEKTGAAQRAANNARAIVDRHDRKDDYEKLHAYLEEICGLVSYDYEAVRKPDTPYGDPWQIVHVFDGNKDTNVVCEGYSKAFQYLCDLSGFEDEKIACYTVAGDMRLVGDSQPGPHMWNVVTMENGKNYMVDITNCDDYGEKGYSEWLFLVGTDEGSADSAYIFSVGNGRIQYAFDEEIIDMYGDILNLAPSNYKPKIAPTLDPYPTPKAVYGQKLGEVAIENSSKNTPGTWKWQDPADTSVGDAGQRQFTADFTPADPETYKSVKNVGLTVTVAPKPVADPVITIPSSTYDYTAHPITPKVTVKDGNVVIPESEYKVTYANNTNMGTASIKVENQAGGNYALTAKTIQFTIAKANLANAKVELSVPKDGYVYDKAAKTPAVTVKFGDQAIDKSWYTVKYAQNVNAGEAAVSITAAKADVCQGTASAKFTIGKKPVDIAVTVEDKVYDGTAEIKVTSAKMNDGQVVSGDQVSLESVTGAFADAMPGDGKAVNLTANFTGKDAANYTGEFGDVTANIIPYEPVAVNAAIENAKAAKEGVQAIDQDPSSVSNGTRFVSTEEMNRFEEVLRKAEEARNHPLTKEEDEAIAAQLNEATEAFKAAIKTGTRRSGGGGGSSSGGGGGGSSSGGGRTSGGPSSSQGSVTTDSKKGQVNSVTGVITGSINGSAGDGYSHWQQGAAQDSWKLQYADGSYAAGAVMTDGAGNQYEQVAWEKVNGAWYAFGADANAKNGWVYDAAAAKWYYVDINVGMKADWVMVGGLWYYLNPDATGRSGKPFGAMYSNETTPDGYYVRQDGSWDGGAKRN